MGFFHKYYVAKESATKLVETLTKNDEERRGRIMVLEIPSK
jgi:hypothetical protein